MPNWCRGTLEVRGMKDNIKKFLIENLNQDNKVVCEDDLKLTIHTKERFYIEGTKGNFVDDDIEFYFATEETFKQCKLNNFMVAWSIDPEPYTHMSKKYDIDIDLFGADYMGGFSQEIEIHKGEIIKYKVDELSFDFRMEDEESMDKNIDEKIDENIVSNPPSWLIDFDDDIPF
jgi:hypothetical protein